MDLHRASILNNMDYSGDGRDGKDGKAQAGTEDRLDSGLDSLKEEEYQAVAGELARLRVDCAPQRHSPESGHDDPWKTQLTEDGDTLLHLAIIHEAKDCARNMIQLSVHEAFLNQQNYQRQTPLHLAVITEQPDLVDLLLEAGADPSLVDQGGNTPLHIACRWGSMACFSLLTQPRPGPAPGPAPGQLARIMAARNYSGQNCLHLVTLHGFLSLVESLVARGADINAQEQCSGRSALHLAVDLQHRALVRLLLHKGADPNSLTYGGHTPYHLTFGRHDDAIRAELLQVTDPALRELPDSESEDSEEEESGQSDEDEVEYDDIQWNGH